MTNNTNKSQKQFLVESTTPLHFHFSTFSEMEKYGKNWSFHCRYRFGKHKFYGEFDICQNEHFQLASAYYNDGLMYNGYAPQDTITLTFCAKKSSSLTANRKILEVGDILIVDDSKEYEIIYNDSIELKLISLRKEFVSQHFPYLFTLVDEVYRDNNNIIEKFFSKVFKTKHTCTEQEIELELLRVLQSLNLSSQSPVNKKLTKKEALLFTIRDYILNNLQYNNIKIKKLLSLFNISERSLQNGFKKIFGITPKKFLNILRLNEAHKELKGRKDEQRISEIAIKWGFENFGRFSKDYQQFYNVLPSQDIEQGTEQLND